MTLLKKWRAWLCARLIEDWRMFWRFWSVRLQSIALALSALFAALPHVVTEIWLGMPDELKQMLPPHFAKWIPIALFAAGIAARLFKQKGIARGR